MAPATNVPAEDPAKIPSFFNKISSVSKATLSLIVTASSTYDRSRISGIKSSPIPSTSQDPPLYSKDPFFTAS